MLFYLSFSTIFDLLLPKCSLYLMGSLFCEGRSSDPHNQLCQHGLCACVYVCFVFFLSFLGANVSLFSFVFYFFFPAFISHQNIQNCKAVSSVQENFFPNYSVMINWYWSTEQFFFLFTSLNIYMWPKHNADEKLVPLMSVYLLWHNATHDWDTTTLIGILDFFFFLDILQRETEGRFCCRGHPFCPLWRNMYTDIDIFKEDIIFF